MLEKICICENKIDKKFYAVSYRAPLADYVMGENTSLMQLMLYYLICI